ncbi:MAG TPA: rhodanese-like domain-containing protein [Candidatus Cybelea sp.]|nr:rhodanese-like domain-containing protein [Candidatus Cybelea sp.]
MSYAGDVSPKQAWEILASEPEAMLVDVRTRPEWSFVGVPDLAKLGKKVVLLSWQVYPEMRVDPDFIAKLKAERGGKSEAPLLFLCRSGARSRAAAEAATAAGFARAYNVAEGFEGDKDGASHRGQRGGWKFAALPWAQD